MSQGGGEPKLLPLRIRLPFATEAEFIERYGANVDRTGLFIATRTTKPEGTAISFELVLQDGARLMRGVQRPSLSKARALALAAVRETFEETGLLLGKRVDAVPPVPEGPWQSFAEAGVLPDLSQLHFIVRAITPPRRPRRFDARLNVSLEPRHHVSDLPLGRGSDARRRHVEEDEVVVVGEAHHEPR